MREGRRRTSDERRRRRSCSRSRSRRRSRSRSRSRSRGRASSRGRSPSRSSSRRSRSLRARRRQSRRSRSPSASRRRHHRFQPASPRTRSRSSGRDRRRRSRSPVRSRHFRFRSTSRSRSPVRDQAMASIGEHVRTEASAQAPGPGAQPARNARSRSHGRSRGRRAGKGPKISIPKNWTDVPKMGGVVGESRFVPIRVPLDDKHAHLFQRAAEREQQWTPRQFVDEQAARGLDVRLVIDLTNTFKYYDGAAEFQGSGVEYVKLKIEGFHAPPQAKDVARFTEIVDAFVAKQPAGRVAVHCTHGLNRTGYLVVTYMVQRLGCSVTEALAAFSDARPPGLIKHMYVEDLYRRLGRDGEEVQLPTLPGWAADKYAARERHH